MNPRSQMSEGTPRMLLLGRTRFETGGQPVRLAPKEAALLAYVYAASNGRVSRKTLSRLLWPKSSSSNRLHSLSQALYVIGRTFSKEALSADVDSIARGTVYCDVLAFRDALEAKDWVDASKLYRGSFAADLRVPESVDFAHWIDAQRSSLRSRAEKLVHELEGGFEWDALLRVTSVLLEEASSESPIASAHLSAVYHLRGQREAKAFVRGLTGQTMREAQDRLRLLTENADALPGVRRTFVGRRQVMDQLLAAYEEGRSARPSLVLLSGEPGIGKTALADRFCRLLALRGARVLSAYAYLAEQNVPLGVAEQWIRSLSSRDLAALSTHPWMRVIRQVFPATEDSGKEQFGAHVGDIGYQRLLESVRRLFIELGKDKPLVLAVDDLHNTDSASVGLLHYLFRRQPTGPTLVLGSIRKERNYNVAAITEWDATRQVTLEGLTPSEITQWLERIGLHPYDLKGAAQSLHERTGGNPLLIATLVEEGQALSPSVVPPQSIIDFFRPRILDRSASAQRLLGAVALAGEPLPLDDLAEIAGLTPGSSEAAALELLGSHLVTREHDSIALRHGLLGEVALSLLSSADKQGLHGRAARVLATGGNLSDALVAVSHDVAGNRADAFAAAVRAAEACDTLHARSEKEFFLKLGLSNAPNTTDQGRIRIQLAELYLQQRRPHEGLDVISPAIFADMPAALRSRAEVVRVRIEAEMAGDVETLGALWKRAESIRGHLDALVLADAYTHLAGISHDLGFDSKSLKTAEEIADQISSLPLTVESARRLLRPTAIIAVNKGFSRGLARFASLPSPNDRDPVYACVYHSTKGSVLVAAGKLLDAEAEYARSVGIAERYALFDHYFSINNNLGVCLMEQGRFEEAERHYRIAEQYAEQDVSPSHHWIVQDNLVLLEFERGHFEAALEIARGSLAKSAAAGIRAEMSGYSIIGLCSLQLGALAQCNEAEREVQILFQRHDPIGHDMSYVHIFLARMCLLRRESENAVAVLSRAAESYRSRNAIAAARIDTEKYRILVRGGIECSDELEALANRLRGSGAVPLIDRVEGLRARA